ncbi:MAG: UDP-N-acetylmuramoyl-L-alanine--D-glutamate ligase, partial [Henriciella sp.]|nr:UDP-N-acetylmuramoyl-L-alanine--D-glutamate ligase [Henriciella sp.]
ANNAVRVGDLGDSETLPGRHNWQNAAAAYAACRALGLDPGRIFAAILTFPGLAHRMEQVGEIDGVRFVNDSKATNAQAAEQALRAYPRVYWIAGGQPKAGGIEPLMPLMGRVAKAYLVGESADDFARTLDGKAPHESCGTLDKAVARALEDAKASGEENPIVLLSPACASFDQFKDFEARGDAFREAVEALGGDALRPVMRESA